MDFFKHIKKLSTAPRALVLMYHRVAQVTADPWDLAVTKENFGQHLASLKSNVIPLSELIGQLREGRIKKNAVCITFDDGYTDNYMTAAPVLEKYNCPATFFIAAGYINRKEMFWWDTLSAIFLRKPQLPPELSISINEKSFHFILEDNGRISAPQLAAHEKWRWPARPTTQRCKIYLDLWQAIRDSSKDEIDSILKALIKWSGFSHKYTADIAPMNTEQLSQLSANKLFSLGVHTMSHPALGQHGRHVQEEELLSCRKYLQQHFSNYTDAVAYPYGHYNPDTLSIMKSASFLAGFTTQERPVRLSTDIYQIGRMKVNNVMGEEFVKQISAWFRQ